MIKDPRYPKCSKLGVLRKGDKQCIVSTSALLAELGWETYQKYLPWMQHDGAGPTAESCERFLETLEK